ncbi:hypothetical protein MD588_21665 [Photobacterium sp. SDRW27]|uniref:MFS transporter n=1 Tax=Photobacterium obscurum TaxID=2829490 RepID=UPI0022437653|nr:MFS transporter [Photobacterium obscurum]MCW8331405.1 hypothetical protein [Photobacterium obscurum]
MNTISGLQRFSIGISLFLGYALFAVAWKVGDFYVQSSLGFSNSQLADSTAWLNIAKLTTNFIVGILVARVAAKHYFATVGNGFSMGLLLAGSGLAIMLKADTEMMVMVGRAVVGLGGGLVLFCQSPVTASVFSGKELNIMNGVNASAYNVGITAAITLSATILALPTEAMELVTSILIAVSITLAALIFFSFKKVQVSETGEVASFSSGLKENFNWVFCFVFSGAIVFYTLSFTFIEPANIMNLLYAGIVGNFAGIFLVGKFDIRKLAVTTTVLASLCAIPFILMGSQIAAMALGFFLFCSLPAFISLAYIRESVNPSSLALTFMLLWVGSDLLVSLMVKVFALVSPNVGNLILLGLITTYGLGTVYIARKYK